MMHESDDKLNNIGPKISLADVSAWFISGDREVLPDHVERSLSLLLRVAYKRSIRKETGSEEERILEAVHNYPKHYGTLVRVLRSEKKTAFDLMRLIGEGSTVAHRIWDLYGGNE